MRGNMKYHSIVLGVLVAISYGCSTPAVDTPVVVTPPATTAGAAICVGLTAVDPAAYQGWAGDCPGCDEDANGFHLLLNKSLSGGAIFLFNSAATWKNVQDDVLAAAATLKRGDLLVVMMSGHGGQLPDDNGDEADGLDETICLWDGQVRDDEVLKLINKFPAGLRVVLINDQCHSEGNFRSFMRKVQRVVTLGKYGKRKGAVLVKAKTGWDGQLIQFAGCREASYSYGSSTGGTWSQNLLSTFSPTLTWRQWFDKAAAKMPSSQVPVWVEYGNITDGFRNGTALK